MKHHGQNNQQAGFSAVIAIVTILAILGLAFGGWWVWERNKNKQTGSSNSSQTNDGQEQEPEFVAPGGWKQYKDEEAGFDFYYPPEWGEVKSLGEETRQIGSGKFFRFTSVEKIRFSAHGRDREVASLEFGNIEPAVVDVSLENNKPVVKLASEFKAFRDFTNDHVIKKLANKKICLAEDYYLDDYVPGDPFDEDSTREHTYFGYCGLASEKFGAFTITSGQQDGSEPETQRFKDDLNGLLKTFEIF